MANRLGNPDIQFCDQSGLPYAGGVLAFFTSGTSTPLAVWSDSALSTSRGTSITLDSAGRAGSVFLSNVQYKVTLTDVNSNLIWTMDPVYSSDFSTLAQLNGTNNNPNGVVTGTVGSAGVAASVIWDYTNHILYVSTGGTAWTAINPAASASTTALPTPQGYLTLASDTTNYILTTDATNVGTFYYTAVNGQLIPIYNGSNFAVQNMGSNQFTFVLPAGLTAGNIYDVFAFMNASTLTIGLGPTWTVTTPGSCSRGSGGGTTQLQRVSGILVNANSISGMILSTSGTASVSANQGTYLGSIFIGGTSNSTLTCTVTYGGGQGSITNNRQWDVWNLYNQQTISMIGGDSSASWPITTTAGTYRQAFSGTTAQVNVTPNSNFMTSFLGLNNQSVDVSYSVNTSASSTLNKYTAAIGWNASTSSGVSSTPISGFTGGNNASAGIWGTSTARFIQSPGLTIGVNNIQMLEAGSNTATTVYGTNGNHQMTVQYRG